MEYLEAFAEVAKDPALQLGAAAATYARQFLATKKLAQLIAEDAKEGKYQKLLEEHHWMLGASFVKRVDNRVIVVGSQYDIILVSVDGFIDLIELKTAGVPLFRRDRSHQNLFPSRHLAAAIGQALHYLLKLDNTVPSVNHDLGIPAHRARVTIVIGKFLDPQGEHTTEALAKDKAERMALRTLNSHLSRIEVRTFTEVLEAARAIQRYTKQTLTLSEADEDDAEPEEDEDDVTGEDFDEMMEDAMEDEE